MATCIRHCSAEAQFDHKVAERDLRRYRRRGPDATARLILAELRRWPLAGRRLLFALENFWLWLIGKSFRAFVHPPQQMGAVLEAAGLMRTARHETVTWVLDLYRPGDAV
jgi:hypothetical protein